MPGKLLGIGLLSVGCVAAAAAGGYLALRPAAQESIPAQLLTVPTTPQAADPVETVAAVDDKAPTPDTAAPAQDREAGPQPAPAAAMTSGATVPEVARIATSSQPAAGKPVSAPASAETPTTPLPSVAVPQSAPVNEPTEALPDPVDPETSTSSPPAPAVAEPRRYVPDAPVPATLPTQAPPRFEIEDLTVEKHSVIGIRLDGPVSTKTARVEDRVTATVSRDVTVQGRTAIPANVRLEGTVTLVEHGGRFKNRPRLGLQFDRMILADGTRVPIATDTIYREGESPTADSTAKVGAGAVAGAILGAVFGGKKGAAIGGVAGAAGGAAVVMKEDAGEATIPAGAPLTVRLTEDLTISR